jgi:hypothetical protein
MELKKESYSAEVVVHDRRTGRVVAKRTFPPVVGACPRSWTAEVSESGQAKDSMLSFGPSDDAIQHWLQTLVK